MSSYLRLIQVSSVSQRFFLSRQQLIVVNILKTFIIKSFVLLSDLIQFQFQFQNQAHLV